MDKAQEREISRLQQEIAAIRERLDRSYDALVTLMGEGGVEFASDAETKAGAIDDKAVTPEGLRSDIPATPAASRGVRLNSSGDAILPGKIDLATAVNLRFKRSGYNIIGIYQSEPAVSQKGLHYYNESTTTYLLNLTQTGNMGLGGITSPAARLDIGAGAMRYAEMTAPSAPAANSVVVFARDNGAGKTELCARFNTGAIQVIAAQP